MTDADSRSAQHVVDARVRLPSPLRPAPDSSPLYSEYNEVIDVGDGWVKPVGELCREMDDAGVSHAVVHAEYEEGDPVDSFNDEVARLVAEQPERFSGFGTVSLGPLRVMRAVRQAQQVADLGLLGINIQPAFFGLAIDDRRLYPVYAKAAELGLAVGIHTGVNYSRQHPIEPERPVHLDQVASDFPDLTLIACHGAWPWIPEMVAVARRHPSVVIDFGGLAPKYVDMAGSGWELLRHHMDRGLRDQVLFATDWPVFSHKRALDEWDQMGLRPETKAALLSGNVTRLLGSDVGAFST